MTWINRFLWKPLKQSVQQVPYGHLIGQTVIVIDCRGCMADDHRIDKIGVIKKVVNQREIYGPESQPLMVAICEQQESRSDLPQKDFTFCVDDTSFQKNQRGPGYFLYR